MSLLIQSMKDKFRKSGEPYIVHPLNVALILTTIYADSETLQAALFTRCLRRL